jgi:hypothetical protein
METEQVLNLDMIDINDKRRIKREYYITFIIKNKEKLTKRFQCEICSGHYKYLNKSHHNASKRHKLFLDKDNIKL